MTDLNEQIELGSRAERIINDPVYKDAWAAVEEHIVQMMKTSPLRDDEGLRRSRNLLHCLNLVRSALEQTMQTGKIAAATLAEQRRGVSYLGDIWPSRRKR